MSEKSLPVVALKTISVLPGMLIHFDVARKRGIAAIEAAMKADQQILLITQRDHKVEEPTIADLYAVGTVAAIKQFIRLPGDQVRVLVEGRERARLEALCTKDEYYVGNITTLEDIETILTKAEEAAMHRVLRGLIDTYISANDNLNKDIVRQLKEDKPLGLLLAQVSVQIPMTVDQHQDILEADSMRDRYDRIVAILAGELEVARIRRDIQDRVRAKVDKNQRDYVLREQLKAIREELGDGDELTDAEEYAKKCEELEASDYVKEKIKKEIDRFKNTAPGSAELTVVRGYIETLLELPWDKMSEDVNDLANAEAILERDHFGLTKVKERIMEFLAVRSVTSKGDSPIICLVGPPGTGKTSIARSVAEALGKKYVRICLGGVRDEAEIRGHRRTYVGAMPGRIIQGIKEASVKNPLMLFDEIDKMSSDYKGDPASAMLEVLDSEQNSKFVDHYIEIPVDLSEVMFICTANSAENIPRPLLDRMELIEVNSYTANEKFHIAKEHLFKKQLKHNGLTEKNLSITDGAYMSIINGYTREAGVRGLERKLGEIARKAVRKLIEANPDTPAGTLPKKKLKVNEKNLCEYLGTVKYLPDKALLKPEVGVVRGLAWTSVGGDTLSVEAVVMPGKGVVELTGKLGEVMQESAKAGVSYIRSVGSEYGLAEDYFEKHDIHIHIPEGAVPKDGPSAGITMATAILSAVTGKKVKNTVAMTGEITLRGKVLPIGGLKEKLLAAKIAGIEKVLVPYKNQKDIDDLESEILDGIEIVYVSEMSEVLKHAFV